MTLRGIALASVALATGCTTAGTEAKPESKPEPTPQPRCFFDGDVTEAVRISKVAGKDGDWVELEWDAVGPTGATWLPPSKVHAVSMPFGVNCREPFDVLVDTGVQATLQGDRSIAFRLPQAMIDGLPGRCASGKLELPLTLTAEYATSCRALDGDGLPFHNLSVLLTVGADGTLSFESVVGSSYLEG